MSTSQIDAKEEYLSKLYDDYYYQIPEFQRPFSWSEDNFVDLVDDLTDAYDDGRTSHGELLDSEGKLQKEALDAYEPYFLGSIILNGGNSSNDRHDIIDGQQRITSLAILVAVLRDTDGIDQSQKLGKLIYEEDDPLSGKEEKARLEVRQRDMEFFSQHILDTGATAEVPSPETGETESEQNILQAVTTFRRELIEWEEEENGDLDDFAVYLTQRVVMVRIKTNSLSSAFRLFNVTNARGMPLNNADLLKSENLSLIKGDSERERYQRKWEDMEEEVGNEGLEQFIGFMRHLLVKDKSRKSIYDEFREHVFAQNSDFRGADFVDYLERVFDIHRERVYRAALNTDEQKKNVYYHNLVSLMRDFYPSDEWIVALILFDDKFEQEEMLLSFITKLERRLTVDWLTGRSRAGRYSRIYDLLKEIENAENPEEILQLPVLNEDIQSKQASFLSSLDANNFYRKGNYQWPKYILMRINIEKYDNRNQMVEYGDNITIEHILPQTPTNGYWLSQFDDEPVRTTWTNRMGNLVLLDGRKNYKASNKPFGEKYEEYFAKKSDFALTNELEDYEEWTLESLEQRHDELKEDAVDIWFDSTSHS